MGGGADSVRNGGSHWLLAILSGNSEVAAICPIDKGTGCYGHPAIQFFREKALEICAWVNQEKEVRSEKAKAKKERVMPTEEIQPEVVPAPAPAPAMPTNETDQVMLILSMLKGMSATNQDWVASELAAMRVQATTPDVAVAI